MAIADKHATCTGNRGNEACHAVQVQGLECLLRRTLDMQAYRKFKKEHPDGPPAQPTVSIPDTGSVM